MENTLRPAGWYPDPADKTSLIYWDGDEWVDELKRVVFVEDEADEGDGVGEDGTLDGEVADWTRYLAHLEEVRTRSVPYIVPEGLEQDEVFQQNSLLRIMAVSLVGTVGIVMLNTYGLPDTASTRAFLSLIPLVLGTLLVAFVGYAASPRHALGDEGSGFVTVVASSRALSFAAPLFALAESLVFKVRVNPGYDQLVRSLTYGFTHAPP